MTEETPAQAQPSEMPSSSSSISSPVELNWETWSDLLKTETRDQLSKEPEISTPLTPQNNYHAVVCIDGSDPYVVSGDMLSVVAELTELMSDPMLKDETYAFVFVGNRAHISNGTAKFIVWPDNTRSPLFVPTVLSEAAPDIDETGLLVQGFDNPLDNDDYTDEEQVGLDWST